MNDTATGDRQRSPPDRSSNISTEKIQRLQQHLESTGTDESARRGIHQPGSGEPVTTRVERFDDRLLRTVLDELLLILIAIRDGACGKELQTDLQQLGYDISPGSLYPHLHDLADCGVLECQELARTKEFSIADADQAQEQIDRILSQLGELSVFLTNFEEKPENHAEKGCPQSTKPQ